ncbi:hypothetical protein M9H77_25605 [Catharanthus roseus]|uniref:Uncharacterized protein n=1 Tax=Catharanthus roseus TaxID=4058 RepID=A0ACC0A8N0_CATRO|nr:hypothetical protein M9H77_25605 [Catharanthus roseus]
MALRIKLRLTSFLQHPRQFSTSILGSDSKSSLTSKEKSRAAVNLLRTEKNPQRIIEICRAASLTPESHIDRVAYTKAISKLKELNYFNGIRDFLEESKARPDMKSERFISHIIVLYGRAGMVSDAVKTFEEMHEMGIQRSAYTLNALLYSCRLANEFKEMKRIYLEFPSIYGIVPNLDVYNTMIKGFCESGESSAAYSILNEMDRKGIKPNGTTFGTMIQGFYKEEKFEDVGKVLKIMEGHDMRPGIGIYNIRIQSLCKLGRSKEAKALFEGILSRQMKPNNVTYAHLIHGFCREGDFEEAKGFFKMMVKSGIQPLSDCYFTLIYFLSKGGDFEAALGICKESMSKNWVPNFSTMKMLVEGLASSSMVDEATEIIGQLKQKFPGQGERWAEIEEGLAK